MTDKPQRGGLRNPPGGRPKKAEADKKIKINITLSKGIIDWLGEQRQPDEPLSNAIERVLQAQRDFTSAQSPNTAV